MISKEQFKKQPTSKMIRRERIEHDIDYEIMKICPDKVSNKIDIKIYRNIDDTESDIEYVLQKYLVNGYDLVGHEAIADINPKRAIWKIELFL